MLEYTVCAYGDGDFSTIAAAVDAVPREVPARILIRNGVYSEKLYCDKMYIELHGESREGTLLTWADGALHRNADGRPNGTFRSYTAFFSGGKVRVENLTIANIAGGGRTHGQGIAAAVDARRAAFYNVALLGCQDTLFTGPLPSCERIPGGFLGPKQTAPRLSSRQYYRDCFISGDIDFIFGGADALFEECTLHCHNRNEAVNGYIAAPSTTPEGLGYVFYRCVVESKTAAPGSFFLARPWRPYGKVAFLDCKLGGVIAPAGFDDWSNPANRGLCTFAEYGNAGPGAVQPRAFGRALTQAQAAALLQKARMIVESSL